MCFRTLIRFFRSDVEGEVADVAVFPEVSAHFADEVQDFDEGYVEPVVFSIFNEGEEQRLFRAGARRFRIGRLLLPH